MNPNNTLLINRAYLRPVAADASPRTPHQEEVRTDLRRPLPIAAWRASRWVTALAALALLLGANPALAVTFDDGLTHTINDATYQNDRIEVRNGTTLIIEPGAVLGGELIGRGNVVASDTSTVTINGGTFGGAGDFSGSIAAWDTSTVTIGGTFGGVGNFSGVIQASSSSTMTINGGTFSHLGLVHGTVTFRASSFDTTSYNSTSGGTLGVTFCSQSPQDISVFIDSLFGGTVNFETVVCENPSDLIDELIGEVNDLSIKAAIQNALVVKLNAAQKALSLGDIAKACARLQDFINLCLAQAGKKIPADTAEELIADALDIHDALDCP